MNVAIRLNSTRRTTGSVKNCPDSSSASGLGGSPRVAHGTDFLTRGVKAAAVPGKAWLPFSEGPERILTRYRTSLKALHDDYEQDGENA
jgi:hypothetical protein